MGLFMRQARVLLCFALALLTACSGTATPPSSAPDTGGRPPIPDTHGPGLPSALPDNFDAGNADKWPSAAYNKFFLDTVNQHSGGRWTTSNTGGAKAFTLSNTFFSSPKSWVIGQNYWNNENDELQSNSFSVPDGTDGIRISYYTRWRIAAGDEAEAWLWDGDSWEFITSYTGGQNADWPAWTKQYFELPANASGMDQNWNVAFRFTSNGSGTDWGFGVDSVSVYQTQLNAPLSLSASDGGLPGEVALDWDHNIEGTLTPDFYDVYRAPDNGGTPGTYTAMPVTSVAYPMSAASDMTGDGSTYWYVVKARKTGWPDSPASSADYGFGDGSWTIVNITNDAEGDGSNSSLAIINGNPAVVWRRATSGGGVAYSRSSTVDGLNAADWSAPVFVDTGDVGLRGTSLQQVAGRPAVVYNDIASGEFLYARAADANGTDWNGLGSTGFILDSGGGTNIVGREPTLRVTSDGFPCTAYTDTTANDIKFAISSDADGANQLNWTKYVVYDGMTVQHPNMEIVGGNPAIAFAEPTGTGQMSYWRASDPSPALADWLAANYAAVTTGVFGSYPALFICNGNPGVAYLDGNSDVFFARSSTATGNFTADWTAGTNVGVDSDADNFDMVRGASLLGLPRLLYYNTVDEDVIMATSGTFNGDIGSAWTPNVVDGATGRRGEPCTPILVNGKIALTYRNFDNDDLMYAVYE
jgi:hypothetical protein